MPRSGYLLKTGVRQSLSSEPSRVSSERLDLDVVIRDAQVPQQPQGSHDPTGCAADVVDRICKPGRRLEEAFSIDPSGRAPPSWIGGARESVLYAEFLILFFQRVEFLSVHNLVLASIAVNEPDRDRDRFVGRIFGHAFEGRDADASRQEHGGAPLVQHEVANRAQEAGLVAGPPAPQRPAVRRGPGAGP